MTDTNHIDGRRVELHVNFTVNRAHDNGREAAESVFRQFEYLADHGQLDNYTTDATITRGTVDGGDWDNAWPTESPLTRLVRQTEKYLAEQKTVPASYPLVDRLRRDNCTHHWAGPDQWQPYDNALDCTKCGIRVVDGYRAHYPVRDVADPAPPSKPAAAAFRVPHGDFTVHTSDDTRTPDNEPAVYVICACGRGYSWARRIPAAQLAAWLANHGPDIPADEEERRVKEATGLSLSGADIDAVVESGMDTCRALDAAIDELRELQRDVRETLKTIRYLQQRRVATAGGTS